jgi:hypothetical protein
MTASAPRGTGAPVMIRVAIPDCSGSHGISPAATSSIIINSPRPPRRSDATTANPSINALSNGGESMSLIASSASTRPNA